MVIYVTTHMATQQLTQSFRPYASLDPGVPSWQTSQCPSEIPQSVVMKYFQRGNFFGYCVLEEMFQGDIMTFNWRRKRCHESNHQGTRKILSSFQVCKWPMFGESFLPSNTHPRAVEPKCKMVQCFKRGKQKLGTFCNQVFNEFLHP